MGETRRSDRWWFQPVVVFLGLSAFSVYSTWAAFQGAHYYFDGGGADYLSPFYSPVIFDAPDVVSGHAVLGGWPDWLQWLPPLLMTPAILILWAPGGFRFTCEWNNQSGGTVSFGESATDEMCFFWAYYYPSKGSKVCIHTEQAGSINVCCPGNALCDFLPF